MGYLPSKFWLAGFCPTGQMSYEVNPSCFSCRGEILLLSWGLWSVAILLQCCVEGTILPARDLDVFFCWSNDGECWESSRFCGWFQDLRCPAHSFAILWATCLMVHPWMRQAMRWITQRPCSDSAQMDVEDFKKIVKHSFLEAYIYI